MVTYLENTDKITWLKGLLVGCPMGKALDDCPVNELRKLLLADRIELIKNMSNVEIDSILEHHKKCITKRENKS